MKETVHNNVILIHSYKGGTGKSALAINLSKFLAKNKKVLLIEQDNSGPTLADVFQLKPDKFWNDFYTNNQIKDLIVEQEFFDIIFAQEGEYIIPDGQSQKIFFSRNLERLSKQMNLLKRKYDHIILDTHPGYNVEIINSLLISDTVILLTRLDSDMIAKTINMYEKLYSQFKSKKVLFIENMVPSKVEGYENQKIENNFSKKMNTWKKFSSTKKVITIPLNNEIAYGLYVNKLLLDSNPFYSYIAKISDFIENTQ